MKGRERVRKISRRKRMKGKERKRKEIKIFNERKNNNNKPNL